MRARLYLVGIMAASSALVSGLWIGCGSSTTANGPPDSGVDAPQDNNPPPPPIDTGVDAPTDAGCAADVDLNTVQVPDADINDAGANTILCVNCLRAGCQAEITECNADCVCETDLVTLFDCIAEAGAGGVSSFQGCGFTSFGNNANELGIALALYGCAQKNCTPECGLPVDAGAVDAGADAEVDAQADASSDGATE
jgi:hypothetical protein